MRARFRLLFALLLFVLVQQVILPNNEPAPSAVSHTILSLYAAYQPSVVFQRTWGSLSTRTIANAVALDASGNIYLAGSCCNGLGSGLNFERALLLKFSPAGDLIWKKMWATGNPFVTGSGANGMTLDSVGNIYLAGYEAVNYTVTYPLILKIDSNGSLIWHKTWTGYANAIATGVALDAAGDIFVAGDITNSAGILLLRFSRSGSLIWQKDWAYRSSYANGIAADSSGNVYLAASSQVPYAGLSAVLLKFNSTGDLEWARDWGFTHTNTANAVTIDPAGSILVTGHTEAYNYTSQTGVPLLKFDSGGTLLLQRVWPKDGFANGLTTDSSGNIYLVGRLNEALAAGTPGILLLKLRGSGDLDWGVAGGADASGAGTGIAVYPSGKFAMSGYIYQPPSGAWVSTNIETLASIFDVRSLPSTGFVADTNGNSTNANGYLTDAIGGLTYSGFTDGYLMVASPPVPSTPDPPGVLAAVMGTNNVTLSWNPPVSNGGAKILGYRLYKGQSNTSETLYRNLSTARTFTDTSLANGVTYYYYVTAVNAYGESAASNQAVIELVGPGLTLPIDPVTGAVGVTAIAAIVLIIFFLHRRSKALPF